MTMKDSKLAIFLLGPPGAGKDTQADLLAKKLNLTLLGSGDIVRENIKKDSEMQKIYDSGKLIPGKVMAQWTIKAIDIKKSFVFSGALRTLQETRELMPFLEKNNYQIKIFNIHINPEETLKRNLLRKRGILDQEEKIKERLKVYQKRTKPVLKFLGKKVIQINGEQSIKNVHKNIINAGGWENPGSNNASACASCAVKCPFAGAR